MFTNTFYLTYFPLNIAELVTQLNSLKSIEGHLMSSLGTWSVDSTGKLLVFTTSNELEYTITASGNVALITGILSTPTNNPITTISLATPIFLDNPIGINYFQPITITDTVSCLVVMITSGAAAIPITVNFDGDALTQLNTDILATQGNEYVNIFYLNNPIVKTANVNFILAAEHAASVELGFYVIN